MALYPDMSTLGNTSDVTDVLIYANTLTGGILAPLILGAFWVIILLGGLFYQMRFSGRERFEVVFAVASFATFGMAVLMAQANGLLQPSYVFITIALSVVSVIWLFFASQP